MSSDPSFLNEYPVDRSIAGIWAEIHRRAPRDPKTRPYYNMRLCDFPPYKALGEPLALQGPAPYRPQICGCDRYIICERMCVCSMECREKPLWTWAKANPEAFAKKQSEMHRWRHLADLWAKQVDDVNRRWESISYGPHCQLRNLQNEESPIGCAYCESKGHKACRCDCDNCGSKYCMGECEEIMI